MDPNLLGAHRRQYEPRVCHAIFIITPLALSAFIHLWNPIGFPMINIDETHYLRRALEVTEGQGPQESAEMYDHPYDHPYFGQILLAGIFLSIGYPEILDLPGEASINSIQTLYLVPRILMGILAVIDTFLVYKIGEIRYGRKVAFIASILFAVMPLTWMFRMVLLDSLLMPFLLSAIFLAVYGSKQDKQTRTSKANVGVNSSTVQRLVLIGSGVSLGLAIFTKIPILTMIPLVAYLVYTNSKSFKFVGLWLTPVIMIPLIWPAYAVFTGGFEEWKEGVFYQVDRDERDFTNTIEFLFNADPVLLVLGGLGILMITIKKRDLLYILWIFPYVITIYSIGGIIKSFHFIEILPALSLASAGLIVTLSDGLTRFSKWSNRRQISRGLPYFIITAIGLFGLTSSLLVLNVNVNKTFFEISAFVAKSLPQPDSNSSTTLMGQHWIRSFSWIPMYIQHKDLYVKDVFPERYLRESLQTDNVLMIVDRQLKHDVFDYAVKGAQLNEIRSIYHRSDRIGLFLDSPMTDYDIDRYPYTNLRESRGLGLIEVRSNFDENNQTATQVIDSPSSDKPVSITLSEQKMPTLKDPNLKVELYASGLFQPTTMAFVGNNDILVLEKDNGTVRRVVDGNVLDRPVLDVNVSDKQERGLLGIAVANQTLGNDGYNKTYVYFFYTESTKNGNDVCPGIIPCDINTNPVGNRIYRYEWTGNELVNMSLILDLPVGPAIDHNGGVMEVGPDGNIYVLVGDGSSCWEAWCTTTTFDSSVNSQSSNVPSGSLPDGRGGILRVTPFGEPVLKENSTSGLLGNYSPLNKYYAYGIRNGFGLAFDPITNKLWDTENGGGYGDEINLVEAGFNSGWLKVQGWWPVASNPVPVIKGYYEGNDMVLLPKGLETFSGKGKYSSPEFVWNMSVGVTALEFLKGNTLGEKYKNDLFVADWINDYLYDFNLSENRTKLNLNGDLVDKTANNNKELDDIVLGQGFGVITDIKEGPDGYLYLVSHIKGNIYRIVPN